MSKIIVLNSGGFDSITLLHDLSILKGEGEIFSLHFLYGARNEKQQLKCVENVCKKLNINNKVIQLPKIDWTQSNFFKEGEYNVESQYLEYRNLIFLSYALSYAEAIGADRIYTAVLKGGGYTDTSEIFFKGLNSFSCPLSGIKIETPYSDIESKEELAQIAVLTGIQPGEYYSCDKPTETGERCGECLDCKALDFVDNLLDLNHPFKALYQSGFNYTDPKFKELLKDISGDREVRALINNDCQLRCSHCFYGFERMTGKCLDIDTYYKALKELVLEHGFTNIHFSGKEPLYDDKILEYARRIKEDKLPCTFNVVTNGINVPKYVGELKECGMNKVFLSVDTVCTENGVRTLSDKVALKAIKCCMEVSMPVEVFIDLHENNVEEIKNILPTLYRFGVKNFYIRTIRSIGNASNQTIISGNQLYRVFEQAEYFCDRYEDSFVTFSISSEYIGTVFESKLSEVFSILDSCYTNMWSKNLFVILERYCDRYRNITLTPDGYVLGCASEVSRPDYAEFSAGNIKDQSLTDILNRGIGLRCNCTDRFPENNCSCMVNKF